MPQLSAEYIVGEMEKVGAVAVTGFVARIDLYALLEEISTRDWLEVPKVVGQHGVRQEYSVINSFPPQSHFFALKRRIETFLNSLSEQLDSAPFSDPIRTAIVPASTAMTRSTTARALTSPR